MKNILIVSFTLFFSIISFGQEELKALKKAYRKKSQSQLSVFLQKWHDESVPIASLDFLSDAQKDVYTIFRKFYNPFHLQKLCSKEKIHEFYNNGDYIVIQNLIRFKTYKTKDLDFGILDEPSSLILSRDSVVNFRPKLQFKQAKVLYMLPKYKKAINAFKRVIGKKKRTRRFNFLYKKLNINNYYGVWEETYPMIYDVYFNSNRTLAKINFRISNDFGEAIYTKQEGEWKLKNSYLTFHECVFMSR